MTAQHELVLEVGRPLLSNSRLHYRDKAKVVAEWRETAAWLAMQQRIPRLGRVSVACWGRYPTRNLPDVDAVAPTLKAVLDGIVDARVLEDDKPPFVQSVAYYEAIHVKGCKPALVVLLTALSEDVAHPGRAA